MTLQNANPARGRLALECALAAAAGFLAAFAVMRVSWWGPDDGAYAYVAERMLAGDVLHKDVQDIHAGYVNFANAAAMTLFGDNMLSMRWPLVILAGFETALVYWFARRRAGLLPAILAAACIAVLAFPLHPNISANWYAFALSLFLAVALAEKWPSAQSSWIVAGFLVMAIFLFRQTTGVFVGMGALTVLLLRESAPPLSSSRAWAGRLLLLCVYVVLIAYLFKAAQHVGFLAFGLPPLIILGFAVFHANVSFARLYPLIGKFTFGALIAIAPLILYHLAHGSLGYWFNDAVLVPLRMSGFDFFDERSYLHILRLSFGRIGEVGFDALANGVFWAMLLLASGFVAWRLWPLRKDWASHWAAPFAVISVFHGVVSLHYEIFIYLFYSTAFLLAALTLISDGASRRIVYAAVSIAVCVGAVYHVGSPAIRPFPAGSVGARTQLVELKADKAGVLTNAQDAALYADLVELIGACSTSEQSIFSVPSNPEFYYLSGRRNPFRFYSTAFGLNSPAAVENARDVLLASDGPELIFIDPDDKYNTGESRSLSAAVVDHMDLFAIYGRHHVYKKSPAVGACADVAGAGGRAAGDAVRPPSNPN